MVELGKIIAEAIDKYSELNAKLQRELPDYSGLGEIGVSPARLASLEMAQAQIKAEAVNNAGRIEGVGQVSYDQMPDAVKIVLKYDPTHEEVSLNRERFKCAVFKPEAIATLALSLKNGKHKIKVDYTSSSDVAGSEVVHITVFGPVYHEFLGSGMLQDLAASGWISNTENGYQPNPDVALKTTDDISWNKEGTLEELAKKGSFDFSQLSEAQEREFVEKGTITLRGVRLDRTGKTKGLFSKREVYLASGLAYGAYKILQQKNHIMASADGSVVVNIKETGVIQEPLKGVLNLVGRELYGLVWERSGLVKEAPIREVSSAK